MKKLILLLTVILSAKLSLLGFGADINGHEKFINLYNKHGHFIIKITDALETGNRNQLK